MHDCTLTTVVCSVFYDIAGVLVLFRSVSARTAFTSTGSFVLMGFNFLVSGSVHTSRIHGSCSQIIDTGVILDTHVHRPSSRAPVHTTREDGMWTRVSEMTPVSMVSEHDPWIRLVCTDPETKKLKPISMTIKDFPDLSYCPISPILSLLGYVYHHKLSRDYLHKKPPALFANFTSYFSFHPPRDGKINISFRPE